jgi:hypothetical protein
MHEQTHEEYSLLEKTRAIQWCYITLRQLYNRFAK